MDDCENGPLDDCPFIDDDDPRCADHFRLARLSRAFGECFDGYRACPVYYKLVREQPQRLIAITHHGMPLQPTGS